MGPSLSHLITQAFTTAVSPLCRKICLIELSWDYKNISKHIVVTRAFNFWILPDQRFTGKFTSILVFTGTIW